MLKCEICHGTGVYSYDENHSTWCKKCCRHENGYWKVTTEHFGEHVMGEWLCKKCGWIRKGVNYGD